MKARLITNALRLELKQAAQGDDVKKVRRLAEKMVNLAIEGNVEAAKFVADRTEGKAHATVDLSHNLSDAFVRLLEHIGTNTAHPAVADSVAGEREEPPSVH